MTLPANVQAALGQMEMSASEMFDGEVLHACKGANAFLPRQPGDGNLITNAMTFVFCGKGGLVMVAGMLYLTNYRLKFKAADRPGATFSIFLPHIRDVTDRSGWVVKMARITITDDTSIDLGIWQAPAFIVALNEARGAAQSLDWDSLTPGFQRDAEKIGDWAIWPRDDVR